MAGFARAGILLLLLGLLLAACRSPFADWEESGPAEDPQKVGVGVHGWPLYERDENRTGTRTDVLWPLSSIRTSPDGELRRASVLFPVVLWEKDGARSRFGVRPLFDVESDVDASGGEVSDVDVLFPVVKWRTTPTSSRFEVRPIWWSGHEGEDRDWTILFPVGGSWRRPNSHGWFAGPLAGGWTDAAEDVNWYGLGLFSRVEQIADAKTTTNGLLGLMQRKTWDDGSSWRVFPLADGYSDDSEKVSKWSAIWPGLIRHATEGDETTDWALPLWYHHTDADSSTNVVVPLWLSHDSPQGRTRILFPLWGTVHEEGLDRTFWGANLLILTERPDGGGVDVLWPFFHYSTEGDDWTGWLFPILWMKREGGKGYTHLWPLYGKSWDGDATGYYAAFPLFAYDTQPDRWTSHLFPVMWLKRAPNSGYTHFWPLFGSSWEGEEERHWSVAWPFFTIDSGKDGWEAWLPAPIVNIDRKGDSQGTTIFPVLSHTSNAKDGTYSGSFGLLVSNWEGDGQGKSDFRVLWRLVQSTDTPEKSVFAFNPLFRHETNARGDDHWSMLFGLVARTREAEDVRWRLLWFLKF